MNFVKINENIILSRHFMLLVLHDLVGKPEGKRPLGRPRHRWADNVEIYHKELGWDGLDRSGSG
jgi:hypothetical protein